jgi:hypothetical protein
MTLPFWTPERKKDYLQLVERRSKSRKYHREYNKNARAEGRYKTIRNGNKTYFQNLKPKNQNPNKDDNQIHKQII